MVFLSSAPFRAAYFTGLNFLRHSSNFSATFSFALANGDGLGSPSRTSREPPTRRAAVESRYCPPAVNNCTGPVLSPVRNSHKSLWKCEARLAIGMRAGTSKSPSKGTGLSASNGVNVTLTVMVRPEGKKDKFGANGSTQALRVRARARASERESERAREQESESARERESERARERESESESERARERRARERET
jgi:hypothetical protein